MWEKGINAVTQRESISFQVNLVLKNVVCILLSTTVYRSWCPLCDYPNCPQRLS